MMALSKPCSMRSRQQGRPTGSISMPAHLPTIIALSTLLWVIPTRLLGQRPTSSADFNEARTLLEQGRLHEAKTSVLNALEHNSKSVEGYNLLGIIESDLQDYPDSLAAFNKALSISPHSVKTLNNLGDLYVAAKRFGDAEREFHTVLRLDPANRDGNYSLGVLLMAKGSAAEAIPYFERVRPQNAATEFNLIRAYFATRRTSEALHLAAELSDQNKKDLQVHFSLGVLLASQKQYKAAEEELAIADALRPDTFEIVYNLGQALLREGQFPKAEITLSRALNLKPESVDAMYLLAQTYANESRPLDALDLLVRAHKAAPQNPDVIFLMAQISMSQNYFEDAIPLLESGLQIAPQRPDLRAALGESYFMAGKVDKAIEEFKKLLATENSARSYSFLGLSYRNLGRFDEAKRYFEQGLKLDPHNASCLFNLGFIAERQGESAAAETYFEKTLASNPNFADALLELANMQMAAKKLPEAETFLRRYVRSSRDPATGYYKLAMVERSLHETEAAERDLNTFRTLSRNASSGPLPYEHLFDYLDNRSNLNAGARQKLDLDELNEEVKRHPDQPENLYLLAEAYLNSGDIENAKATIAHLDELSSGDYRSLAGTGVLLARYRLYDDAIAHFRQALRSSPDSDDVKFDLANAYFHKHLYSESLEIAQQVSADGKKDEAYQALLGDLYAHMGSMVPAAQIFENSIHRNPDSDQAYLSLALLDLREGNIDDAEKTLVKGQARVPDSAKIYWGLGLTSALQGDSTRAEGQLERAVDLLPEWPAGYSTLGVLYFETGQIDKAREVLSRFKNSAAHTSLDIDRIEQVLDEAPPSTASATKTMTDEERSQFLQLALSLADRTL
jgi:putative PEP-CTERM system TPR-repeat lipoprotein